MSENYKFFQNRECEYFPCHKVDDPDSFNCMFCFCPLYMLGDKCGGNFHYTQKGVKSCKDCSFPHDKDSYDKIRARFPEIAEKIRKK